MEKDKRVLRQYIKRADRSVNKIIIPKPFCVKADYEFLMTVYDDKIVIEPLNRMEKEN